jgi:AsmA protein
LGASWPAGSGLRGLKIKGQLDWSGSALAFDKSVFQMDGNEATGALTASLAGKQPSITGTLALKSLDVTEYLTGQSAAQRLASLSWNWLASGEISMPLSKHFDADVRMSASRVVAGSVAFGRSAAALSLKDGQLLADFAELDLDGARGSGQLAIDFTGARPKLMMRGKLDDVDAGRATSMIFGGSPFQGTATVDADLTATGERVSDLVDTVSGKLAIGFGAGGRLGVDVKSLLDAVQKQEIEGWDLAARGQTSLDRLDARLLLRDGVVSSERVQASAGDVMLTATGTVHLATNWLDARVLVGSPSPSAAHDARAGRPDVLLLRGPWASPAIKSGTAPPSGAGPGAAPAEPAALPLAAGTRDSR